MLKTACHCGNVQIEVSEKPDKVLSCNCSTCGRYGAIWGYFTAAQVSVTCRTVETETYRWGKETTDFHHCPTCGCLTHYTMTEHVEVDKVAINTRMASREDMEGIPVLMFDGADTWDFVEGHPGWGGW